MSDNNLQILIEVFKQEIQGITLVDQVIILFIETAIAFLVWALLHKKKRIPLKKYVLLYLFLIYFGILLSLTIFRRPEGSREGIVRLSLQLGFGLKTGKPSLRFSAYTILNILLFVPLGIISYLAFENDKKPRIEIFLTTLIGATISLIIECTQLITGRGMFEVTDIFTNTSGSLIGALIGALALQIWHRAVIKHQKR